MPPLPRSPPEGVTTEWTVIAPADEAYYSFIDPVRMKAWADLVGWPTADGINGYLSAAGLVQTSESSPVSRRSETDVLPLSHPTKMILLDGRDARGAHARARVCVCVWTTYSES